MNILFRSVRFKNFLSTGNDFTEIRLDKSKSTLIIGDNGAGKSTILDALSFGLFGVAYRNINKPDLVNSITGKGLLVEVEFDIDSNSYLVRRGINKNVFEIFKNGLLLRQPDRDLEYQKILETQILKMTYKTFTQIVIIGSANFVPFMQLKASQRREFIEDILDIKVFSRMSTILKDRVKANKESLREVENRLATLKELMETHRKHYLQVKQSVEDQIAEKTASMNECEEQCDSLERSINEHQKVLDVLIIDLVDIKELEEDVRKFHAYHHQIKDKKTKNKKEIAFYEENDNCPICKQSLDSVFKEEALTKKNAFFEELLEAEVKCLEEQEKRTEKLTAAKDLHDRVRKLQNEIALLESQRASTNKLRQKIKKEIEVLNFTKNSPDNKDDLIRIGREFEALKAQKEQLIEQRHVMDQGDVLLKDTGIKSKIIAKYVPIINKLVNKYLQDMEFFVSFEINEHFEETIKTRFMSESSYMNFSQGEKQRIDLALVFAWRGVAKMRNSASTNLLFMDEVFDGSCDEQGIESIQKILDSLPSTTNTFLISHRGATLHDKFHSLIEFHKIKNFSTIKRR